MPDRILSLTTKDHLGDVVLTALAEYVEAVQRYVKPGEHNAITQAAAVQLMGHPATDSNMRKWRKAVEYWQYSKDVLVAATTKGYFIVSCEEEREKCRQHKMMQIRANTRRMARIEHMSLGGKFQ